MELVAQMGKGGKPMMMSAISAAKQSVPYFSVCFSWLPCNSVHFPDVESFGRERQCLCCRTERFSQPIQDSRFIVPFSSTFVGLLVISYCCYSPDLYGNKLQSTQFRLNAKIRNTKDLSTSSSPCGAPDCDWLPQHPALLFPIVR